MKKALIALAMLMAATGTTATYAHKTGKAHNHAAAKKYTCSMHPEVVQDKPGKCPKCGMKLVAMKPEAKKK